MSVARNYAKAFYETLPSNGSQALEQAVVYRKEVADFFSVLESSKNLRAALVGPISHAGEKVAIVVELARLLKLSKPTLHFLQVLAQHDRLGNLPEILEAMDEVRLHTNGGVVGKIESADALDPAAVQEIAEAYTQKLKKKVEFKVSTNPQLLAGLKVTVGGVTYDGTLRSQLDRLRDSFVRSAAAVQQ